MNDPARLTFAWVVVVLTLAFEAWMVWLAVKAGIHGSLMFILWLALAAWGLPVTFFMAVWIRRIHKDSDVSPHPTPTEVPLRPDQAHR